MFEKLIEDFHLTKMERIDKGWSADEKYFAEASEGQRYLLRLSDALHQESKTRQFAMLKKVSDLNINCTKPISMGRLEDGRIFMLLSYLEGNDAGEVIKTLDRFGQYALGTEAGRILVSIHSLPPAADAMDWEERMNRKFARKLAVLEENQIDLPHKDLLIDYVKAHKHLFQNRKQVFQHGDYHAGNMIVNNGKIGIIDFDRMDSGDPYEEFKCFCWNVYASPFFTTGLIDGYFDGKVPDDFFPLVKLYAAEALLGHIPWAKRFGEEEVKTAYKVLDDTLNWYDCLRRDVPTWYKKP